METNKKLSVGKYSIIKKVNKSLIMDVIRKKGPISRIEIAEITDLTPATITNLVNELLDSKLIMEAEVGESSGGRKPIMLTVRNDYYRIIGIYIGAKRIKIMVSDLMANTKYNKEIIYEEKEITYNQVSEIIQSEIESIKEKCENQAKKVVGIGIGINGIVDTSNGTLIFAPNLSWRNVKIKEELEEKFNIPVFVDNNTRTMALGESWFGTGKNSNNFFCMNIDYGVGGSFCLEDKIYRGASFGAGEIGHTTVDINGETCSCGNKGCLETVASVKSLMKKVYDGYKNNINSMIFEGRQINTIEDIHSAYIFEAANMGDEFAISLIKEIGEKIGIGIANIINTLNPELVIINGEIISTGEILLEPIRQTVLERGFRSSVNSTQIVLSKLGSVAYLKGAVALATQHIFEDPDNLIKTVDKQ